MAEFEPCEDGWQFDFRHLYRESGRSARYSDFALDVRALATRQPLPGYRLEVVHLPTWTELLAFPAGAVDGTGITCGKAVNAVVLSGATGLVLSGASPSCYQAHELRCRPRPAGLSAPLNLTNLKALTCYWGSACVWTGANWGSLAGEIRPLIVALLNQKGGVDKTTLATHIAGKLALREQNVILLDADPQGRRWTGRSGATSSVCWLFSAVDLARETLHQEAPELARRADHVIIDGPPRIAALARPALLAADRVLIPVQPSPYDLWASAEMVNLIREAQVFRPMLRAAFAINRRVSTTVIGREARGALADQPLPALQAEVRQRIVFAESVDVNWRQTALLRARSAAWSTSC